MRIRDVYPLKGSFRPGEAVELQADLASRDQVQAELRLIPTHLASPLPPQTVPVALTAGNQSVRLTWAPPPEAPRAYGVTLQILDPRGEVRDRADTACDVLPDWRVSPRYGFLCDFDPDRTDLETVFHSLLRFHVNGLQFYDWQYRHDRLVAPEAIYEDPLGRKLSLDTVRRFAQAAGEYGMAAMPYLAVYAASLPFWHEHGDWRLHDARGEPLKFMDFLGLMDPTPGGPWQAHLRHEASAALAAVPFDGLHVDQYGDPKVASDAAGREVDLPGAFTAFIGALKDDHPGKTVLFNAVGNWPIEALAGSEQDFSYIEVWPPQTRYLDLVEIVANARLLSGNKPVVIALYLPADRPANIRLADALICSAGGSRIEWGEGARLLADPYFPKHQAPDSEALAVLRRYADFAVRYGELIGPYAGDDPEAYLDLPPGIWGSVRACPGWRAVSLVNLGGPAAQGWDVQHPAPPPRTGLEVRLKAPWGVREVWWASPDRGQLALAPADFQKAGPELQIRLPYLDFWAMAVLKLDEDQAGV